MVAGLMVGAASRSKSARRLVRGKRASCDASLPAPFGAFVDFGGEDLGEEREVALLGSLRDLGEAGGVGAHDGQSQLAGGGADRGGGGGVGHLGHWASRRSS